MRNVSVRNVIGFIWLIALAACCEGVEVQPIGDVPPYKFVRVKCLAEPCWIDVLCIVNGQFGEVDLLQISPTEIAFVGPPGQYRIAGFEDGSERFSEYVRIGKQDDGDDDDKDDDDDSDDDDQKSKYGIGPAVYRAAKGLSATDAAKVSAMWVGIADLLRDTSITPETAMPQMASRTLDVVSNRGAWQPVVNTMLEAYRGSRKKATRPWALKEWEESVREAATWLRRVK